MEDEHSSNPTPQSTTWSCRCGRTGNLGKFCIGCGRSRAEGEVPAGTAPVSAAPPRPAATSTASPMSAADDVTQAVPRVTPSAAPQAPPPPPVSQPQPAVRTLQPSPAPASAPTADNKTKALLAIIAVLVLVIGVFLFKGIGSDHTSSQPAAQTTSSSGAAKPAREMQSDLSLGSLDLDMSIDDVRKTLGQETTSEQRGMYNFLLYDDVEVGTYKNSVRTLVSNSPAAQTKRGIHEGSSLADMQKAYGTDCTTMDYDDLTLYEYSFQSMKGSAGLLRFAVKKSDHTVKYISIRIPEDEKPAAQAGNQDANAAAQTLNTYYQDITGGKMDAAYGLLSVDMQRHMGTLDQFRQGYQTTISHQLSDVSVVSTQGTQVTITYTLTARDRTQGKRVKVQTFRCEATLSKATGNWHIVDMSAKKQGERME